LLANFIFISHVRSQEVSWNLKKYSNGVAVYNRENSSSSVRELKSVCQLKASISSVVAVLTDWESYPEWVYRCSASSALKELSDSTFIHYQTVQAPWPVQSRDFIVMVTVHQDPRSKVVTITAAALPDYIPRKKDFVRITLCKSAWTITPLTRGILQIEYRLLVDPGGSVPAWLVNAASVDGPFQTSLNLMSRPQLPKYKDSKLSFITEP
jgi:hypothetical protein